MIEVCGEKLMKTRIEAIQSLVQKYKTAASALVELEGLRGKLEDEARGLLGHLSGLPMEVLALPQSGAEHWPAATNAKLRSLASVRTKLELLPGVKARQEAEVQALRPQLRAAVKALRNHCRDEALARMERQQAELAGGLTALHGGDTDRAKAAAAKAIENCDAWDWAETFRSYTPASDPVEEAETVVGLAEKFSRSEPCS